ncbi:nuclear transport factor 2 family protein [Anaeromyxobacter terrae]|uniref:nuclear transport factor 2 family protein n=1 Tax=Anaeromyxobacter terrae TaxID=2925406 RepID=UPI001F5AE511|nr:nuclear transport factor 2 family protein [Anaeromyxobacter sp. SG22]
MNRRTLVVVLALAAALGAVIVARLARPPPSDEERIRALLDGAARAAVERRIGDVVAGVSERFRGEGLDRRGLKQLVAAQVLRGEWVGVSISGVRVAVDGDRATAVADAVLSRSLGAGKALVDLLPGEASAHRFDLVLEREAGGWRVVGARWRAIPLADAIEGPPAPPAPGR